MPRNCVTVVWTWCWFVDGRGAPPADRAAEDSSYPCEMIQIMLKGLAIGGRTDTINIYPIIS